MSASHVPGFRIAGVATTLPADRLDNAVMGERYGSDVVRKVMAMAGVANRRIAGPTTTSADLCADAAARLLDRLGWSRESITGLVFVTQTPDYLLPSTSCVLHHRLGLADHCAAFDVGLGCSGYPYGLYIGATMLRGGGHDRILVLHGETPSHFTSPDDHSTTLLFSDAGSATALQADPDAEGGYFCLHTDGTGHDGLIIRGGGFRDRYPQDARQLCVEMDGAAIFNFTIRRVPPLVEETLRLAGRNVEDVDRFVFHQSNRFIMKHLAKKCGLPEAKVPFTIESIGNCGGPSVPVTLARCLDARRTRTEHVMAIGYGVGLSWGAALIPIDPDCVLDEADLGAAGAPTSTSGVPA